MEFVKDMENFEFVRHFTTVFKRLFNIGFQLFIQPLRVADPPIILRNDLESFITDVFGNFAELHRHHQAMLEKMHHIQRDEHPLIESITGVVCDTILASKPSYMEYISAYPSAKDRLIKEEASNSAFSDFLKERA